MRWIQVFATAVAVVMAAASDSVYLPRQQEPDYSQLFDQLSAEAEVFVNSTLETRDLASEYQLMTNRWSQLEAPRPTVVVVPARESDVVVTIKFAALFDIPFLVYNGMHGSVTTLGRMDYGIEIYMGKLDSIQIATDGKTATVGGGTNAKKLIDALWAAGKQTVTGTCECVSYLGPALGGGHGWLQGRYGLIADQFVSLNVVLADGSLRTVNANSDLFWALKGAGHNFGVVTSATIKIFPRVHTTWAIETLMFTGDKVAAVYQAANNYLLRNGTQPVDVINWSYWFNIPGFDGPVVAFYIIQEGVSTVNPAYTQPFRDLGPFSIEPATGTYRDVSAWVGINLDAPPCQKAGLSNPRFPVYLERYNATAQAEVYALFKAITAGTSPFANSLFMFEGYSMQGVKGVADTSAAYAYRGDNLLTAPLLQYTPAGAARDAQAKEYGNQLRQVLHRGSGRSQVHAYVNYAYGDEGAKAWYGADAWRQDKLKALKKKYDPSGRFSFYAPVA